MSAIPSCSLVKDFHGSSSQVSGFFLTKLSPRSLRSGARHCLYPRLIWFIIPRILIALLHGTLGFFTNVLRSARSMIHYALLDDLAALGSLGYPPPLFPGICVFLSSAASDAAPCSLWLPGTSDFSCSARLSPIALPGFCISHRVI